MGGCLTIKCFANSGVILLQFARSRKKRKEKKLIIFENSGLAETTIKPDFQKDLVVPLVNQDLLMPLAQYSI